MKTDFKDFEDSIQYIAASHNLIDYIITRNIKDFKNSEIKVLTPTDFIEMTKSNQ